MIGEDRVADRLRRLESSINDIPTLQTPIVDYDTRIPSTENLRAVSASIATHLTSVAVMWSSPMDPTVARYEVWVARVSNGSTVPHLAASVLDSPATFNLTSDVAGNAIAFVRTVLKGGLITPLTAAPSVTFQVF